MRIQCPDCAARYEVPDDRLATGRTVRCARCGRDWTPLVPEAAVHDAFLNDALLQDAGEAEPADEHRDEAMLDPPMPAAPPRAPVSVGNTVPVAVRARPRRTALLAAWMASLLVLAAAAWAAVAFRGPIAAAWPPSLRVYGTLHLPIPDPPVPNPPVPPGH